MSLSPMNCKICRMSFHDEPTLFEHISIHIGRRCKTCNQAFKAKPAAAENSDDNHRHACFASHQWLCSMWQKSNPTSCKFDTPASPLLPRPNISGAAYDRSTVSDSNYVQSTDEWQCQYCPYKAVSKHRLRKHIRVHTNERPYQCKECGRRFTVQCNLAQHILSIHVKEKPFKCEQCGLGFIRKDKLREHQRIHTGERPFNCPHCSHTFARKSSLNKHIKTHTGFHCRYCGNLLPSEAALKTHKKEQHSDCTAETGARWLEYGCHLCQKRFSTEEALQAHTASHTGHPCSQCHNVFDTKVALQQHECKPFQIPAPKYGKNSWLNTAEPLQSLKDKIELDMKQTGKRKTRKTRKVEAGAEAGHDAENTNTQFWCAECDKYFKSGQSLGGHRARMHSYRNRSKNVEPKQETCRSVSLAPSMASVAEDESGANELDMLREQNGGNGDEDEGGEQDSDDSSSSDETSSDDDDDNSAAHPATTSMTPLTPNSPTATATTETTTTTAIIDACTTFHVHATSDVTASVSPSKPETATSFESEAEEAQLDTSRVRRSARIKNRGGHRKFDEDEYDQMLTTRWAAQPADDVKKPKPKPTVKRRTTRKKVQKPKKNCPAMHGLQKGNAPDNRVIECDECEEIMYLNGEKWGCRWCNYDLCVECYTGERTQKEQTEKNEDDNSNKEENELNDNGHSSESGTTVPDDVVIHTIGRQTGNMASADRDDSPEMPAFVKRPKPKQIVIDKMNVITSAVTPTIATQTTTIKTPKKQARQSDKNDQNITPPKKKRKLIIKIPRLRKKQKQ